jgi:hypothetical protein
MISDTAGTIVFNAGSKNQWKIGPPLCPLLVSQEWSATRPHWSPSG